MKNIVILISGRGSNMEAIVQRCAAEGWPARVVAVIANRADAAGLRFAAGQGIATQVVDHRAFATREAFDDALALTIDAHAPDLVVLAGFMRILGAGLRAPLRRPAAEHPSVAAAGLSRACTPTAARSRPVARLAGATVHFVTPELDHGPIVIQAVVPVLPRRRRRRPCRRVCWPRTQIYPRAVRWFVEDAACASTNGVVRQRARCAATAGLAQCRMNRSHACSTCQPNCCTPCCSFDAPADGVVSAFFRQHRALGTRERHTLAETTYAVLRQRLLFQHLAQSGNGELERRLAILALAGQRSASCARR